MKVLKCGNESLDKEILSYERKCGTSQHSRGFLAPCHLPSLRCSQSPRVRTSTFEWFTGHLFEFSESYPRLGFLSDQPSQQ